MTLTFFETPRFVAVRETYFSDDAFRAVQNQLLADPNRGDVMPGWGGLRKLRVADPRHGKGTRGGLRVIYLPVVEAATIVLFGVYDKDGATDSTSDEKRAATLLAIEAREEIVAGFRSAGNASAGNRYPNRSPSPEPSPSEFNPAHFYLWLKEIPMNRLLFGLAVMFALAPCAFAQGAAETDAPKVHSQAQAALASKKVTFARAAAASSAVKGATNATDLSAVKKMLGKEITITGTVAKVFAPSTNTVVVLNFADEYWTAATVAVKSRYYAKFPDMKSLSGKTVVVTGRVIAYKDSVQIEVSDPTQIKIVQAGESGGE